MKFSYYAGLAVMLLFAATTMFFSGGTAYFIDLPSMIAITGTCFGALVCNFGFRGSLTAVGSLFSPGPHLAGGFRKSAAKTVILSGLFGGLLYLIVGVVAALGNIGDLSKIGPALAMGFLSLLYGSLLALIAVPAYVAGE
ncbi:hypothetical protein [Salidesulfovibrio onnuriiensis]|uniref:hypothetical protein n=1 Tax=Salidesulfovibrio onnuriiensis TaxID=2583823 RepID=UPI0011CAC3D2|nr:hypothetical protein [Salidesulfovibrio onnuriiensis]